MLAARLLLPCLLVPVLAAALPVAAPAKAVPIAEQRVARHFESIRNDRVALRSFLRAMPKGGDIHSHLSGAIYAESYIRWAAEDGLCVDTQALTILKDKEPCDRAASQRAAKEAHVDPIFYGTLIDALSMRNHHPARTAGEYQFFGAFPRFGPVSGTRRGDMLAEVARRAAAQNILYLELSSNWDLQNAVEAAAKVEWTPDLAALHQQLLDAGLRDAPKTARLDAAEKRMKEVLRCDASEADPGCRVIIRYQAESLRAFTPVQVFAMLVWSFEQNRADARFASINMVQPEDWHVPVRDYDLHMKIIEYLHGGYPEVNITLHAGELTLGQVPPEMLGTHVAKAIGPGHARRVGHGSDIAYHPKPRAVMDEMKRKDVAVEISLSSSDFILGVRGDQHPLRAYIAAGVPVVLATDDEGVARSDLTNEYLRAAVEHRLGYRELKKISRDSLRYAFLPDGEKRPLMERLDRMMSEFEAAAPDPRRAVSAGRTPAAPPSSRASRRDRSPRSAGGSR